MQRLLSLVWYLVLALPALAQTTTIQNPGTWSAGGGTLADFPSTAPGWAFDFNAMAWGDLD
ncbi:MAG: hypothetical protein HYZ13_06110 [Acidobacteria bacterium]|nr:hypothetical protein [Acidobacteriota bacterium]